MAKYDSIIVSCEHAGNEVPVRYKSLFKSHEKALKTHMGYDIGALEAAKKIAARLGTSLYLDMNTRLLVEPNRSTRSSELFSYISDDLPDAEKARILEQYYFPYRNTLAEAVAKAIQKNGKTLHLSIHSCAPALRGEERRMDYGILYDPKRAEEKEYAAEMKKAIHQLDLNRIVRFNYPYKGISDGVCTSFRGVYTGEEYLGIEIEINQKYPEGENRKLWQHIQEVLTESIAQVCGYPKAE